MRVVGTSGDKGADIIAHKDKKRWLFQVKQWSRRAGAAEVEKTVKALSFYSADIPLLFAEADLISLHIKHATDFMHNKHCASYGTPMICSGAEKKLQPNSYPPQSEQHHQTRPYQETAIKRLIEEYNSDHNNRAMIVMATGLGKTRVMCEFVKRISIVKHHYLPKILVLAHTNDLVYPIGKSILAITSCKSTNGSLERTRKTKL